MALPPLRLLDRVEFQLRHQHLARTLLPKGAAAFLATSAPAALEGEVAAVGPGSAQDQPFQQRALLKWPQIARGLGWVADDSLTADAHLLDWAQKRFTRGDGSVKGLGEASLLGSLHCHQLLGLQLAAWHGENTPPTQDARRHSDQLHDVAPTTGDVASHWLALLGLRDLLWRAWPTRPAGVAASWRDLLPELAPAVRDFVLRFAARNEPTLAEDADLRAAANAGELRPEEQPLILIGSVQRSLARLQKFSSELVFRTGQPNPGRPFDVADAARHALTRFRSLTWAPLPAESAAFRQGLATELETCAYKVADATVTPRPHFYNSFLRWARERFVLYRGVHFPLSGLALPAMAYCHNLLVLTRALREGVLVDEARAALNRPRTAIEAGTPTLGDGFMIHLAVDGLRNAFARGHRLHEDSRWGAVFAALPDEVAQGVVFLAARSPVARLAVPDLDERLTTDNVPWSRLPEFLDDPAGEPLREFVAASLADEVESRPALLAGPAGRTLRLCLETNTLSGALLVGEFFAALLPKLFNPCQRHAVAVAGGLSKPAELRAALKTFKRWFFPQQGDDAPEPNPVADAVYELLAELLARKVKLARAAEDDRFRLLNRHWHALTDLTTRGLSDQPWLPRPQRLLRCYWLQLGFAALRRIHALPNGLDTGSRRWDDLATLACKLWALLLRAAWTYDSRSGKAAEADPLARDFVPTTQDEQEEKQEFAVINQVLQQAIKFRPLRDALLVRRLLVRHDIGGKPVTDVDRARVLEYAAEGL